MRCDTTTSASANALSMALSSTVLPSGETPVPLGTRGTARLLSKSAWITVGWPVIATSGSTTAGRAS